MIDAGGMRLGAEVDDNLLMLVTELNCRCPDKKYQRPSPIIQTCHQDHSSQTSVTNMNSAMMCKIFFLGIPLVKIFAILCLE